MKKINILVLCFIVILVSGCFQKKPGIRIVGYGDIFETRTIRGAGTIMRERYLFSYPENSAAYMLVAEDLEGHILTEGVTWSLANPDLGKLIPEPPPNEYIQKFEPMGIGETIVTAQTAEASDTATIVVYPGWGWNSNTFPGPLHGFNFARGEFVIDEAEADIWWPGDSKIRFEAGYWTDRNIGPSLDAMETITVEGKEIVPGPVDYREATDADGLFLVLTRDGAIYAAIVTRAKLVYKPTPLIPAP